MYIGRIMRIPKTDVDASLPINFSLDKPADAVFFAFSYVGSFRGATASDEYMVDWEIYHRPFTKFPELSRGTYYRHKKI